MLEVCVEQAANTRKDEGPYPVYRSATYARCALVERVCCIRDSAWCTRGHDNNDDDDDNNNDNDDDDDDDNDNDNDDMPRIR